MSVTLRRFAVLALTGLALLGRPFFATEAQAQIPRPARPPAPVRPNPFVPSVGAHSAFNLNVASVNPNWYVNGQNLRQLAANTAVIGNAYASIPPWVYGYNPYPSPVINNGAIIPYSPYGVSTVPGAGNPYLGTASLATDPYAANYGLSTTPGGYGGSGGYPYSSYGSNADGMYSYGGYLRGAADLTRATGQYWKDIESARLTREQVRQANLETRRRRIMDEAAFERMKPTAQDLHDQYLTSELNRARRDPPMGDVWSGRALNQLLRSVKGNGKFNRGPNIPLDEDVLKNINVTDGSSRANLGLLKDRGNLAWPLTLKEKEFDEARKRLDRNMVVAVRQLNDEDPLDRGMLKDIRADYQTMSEKLSSMVGELLPSQYIEARRYLNQLDDAIKALEDPKAVTNFKRSWRARGATVAELMNNMIKDGLQFAPATPGDESAYSGLYQAIRAYEASLAHAGSSGS